MPSSPLRPIDRTHTARYFERAVTYTWDLAEVQHPDSDTGTATTQAVLTVTWEHNLHRYRGTIHHQTIWPEEGHVHHTRDPRRTITIATKSAGRFGPRTLRSYAYALLNRLDEHAHLFTADAVLTQDTLIAA